MAVGCLSGEVTRLLLVCFHFGAECLVLLTCHSFGKLEIAADTRRISVRYSEILQDSTRETVNFSIFGR